MLYANQPIPKNDSPAEVKEPAAAYYTGRVGNTVAEPYETTPDDDWDDNKPMNPEKAAAIRRDPEFIAWEQEVIGKIMEGLADIEAGRVYPMDEVVDEILRDIENGTI